MYASFMYASAPFADPGNFTPSTVPSTIQGGFGQPSGSMGADDAQGSPGIDVTLGYMGADDISGSGT